MGLSVDWGTQELPYPVYHVSPYGPDKPLWLHLHRDVSSDGAMNLSQKGAFALLFLHHGGKHQK